MPGALAAIEQVLGALKTTSRVNKALAVSSAAPRNRYYAIKEALINTVHAVHIPWRLVQPSTLGSLNQELGRYRTVFTTNYDLLSYWAIQHTPETLTDLFLGADHSFDLSQTSTDKPRLLYLHGGLHLVFLDFDFGGDLPDDLFHCVTVAALRGRGSLPQWTDSDSASSLTVAQAQRFAQWGIRFSGDSPCVLASFTSCSPSLWWAASPP